MYKQMLTALIKDFEKLLWTSIKTEKEEKPRKTWREGVNTSLAEIEITLD